MKELLNSLTAFAANPQAVGDNLFQFFATIGKMNWEETMAAGLAIGTLKEEAYRKANEGKAETDYSALRDPTYMRLKSCSDVPAARLGQLIAEAPEDRRKALVQFAVTSGASFLSSNTRKEWKAAVGL